MVSLSQKLASDNDITFDDNPLDASEGQRSLNRRSIDVDGKNTEEHWLWSQVHRVKRDDNDWWPDFFSTKSDDATEPPSQPIATEPSLTTEHPEESPSNNDVEQADLLQSVDDDDDLDEDIDDDDNVIEGSGTPQTSPTSDVRDTKLDRYCKCGFCHCQQVPNNCL